MKSINLSPIALFVYKRLDTLQLTVAALKQNYFANESELFIFSDAAKTSGDKDEINKVRDFIRTISGFRKVCIFESDTNKGLAISVIEGVSRVLKEFGKVIVLEDDLVTSSNFLSYMNNCLEHYKDNNKVFSISGYTVPIKADKFKDVYFTKRSSSWGWATWKERWEKVDWEVKDYKFFKDDNAQKKAFNKMGSDLSSMLKKQMDGSINSWAVRWCYHQFKYDLYSVYPMISKVKNIGFGEGATHTLDHFNRYETKLDKSDKINYTFPEPYINKQIIKLFLLQFSLYTRAKYKVLNTVASLLKR